MPSLLIDGRAFSLQSKGGVSQIWAKILVARDFRAEVDLHLVLYPGHEKNIHLQESGLLTHPEVRRTMCSIPPSDNSNHRTAEHRQKRLGEILRDRQGSLPDVVLNTYYGENLVPDCPRYVVVVHDFAHEDLPLLAQKPSTPEVVRRKLEAMESASELIYISGFTKNRAETLYPQFKARKSTVIYHGHDQMTAQPPRSAAKFVHVGTRGGYKNFGVVLQAMKPLLASYPRLKFAVVGGEPADDALKALMAAFPEQVTFETDVSDDRVMEQIASSDGYISASEYEGFGIPLLNAMSFGTWPILADIPPYRELAAHFGSFFPSDRADLLQDQLVKCMNAPDRRRPIALRPWEQVAKDYLTLLKGHGTHV